MSRCVTSRKLHNTFLPLLSQLWNKDFITVHMSTSTVKMFVKSSINGSCYTLKLKNREVTQIIKLISRKSWSCYQEITYTLLPLGKKKIRHRIFFLEWKNLLNRAYLCWLETSELFCFLCICPTTNHHVGRKFSSQVSHTSACHVNTGRGSLCPGLFFKNVCKTNSFERHRGYPGREENRLICCSGK